jgi:hypothetical protein
MSGFNSIIPTLGKSPFLGPNFSPSNVSEIASGYWWVANSYTGIGTTGFRVIEQNGHSSFDLVQTTVASQPTVLLENNKIQFRLRKQGDTNPTILKTAGDISAGWVGNTYMAGWWRLPDASGAITGTGTLFAHRKAGVARFNSSIISTAGGRHSINASGDGTTMVNHQYANAMIGGNWIWLELIINFDLSSPESLKFFANFVELTRVISGSVPASVANVAAPISIGFASVTSLSNADTTDWAATYYGNGIPSLANRKRLANFYNPSGVPVV